MNLNLKTDDAFSEGELEELRQLARWAQEEEARQSEGGQSDPAVAPNVPKPLNKNGLKQALGSAEEADRAMNQILKFHPKYKKEFDRVFDHFRMQSAPLRNMVDGLAAQNAELKNRAKPLLAHLERIRNEQQDALDRLNPKILGFYNEWEKATSKARSQVEQFLSEEKRSQEGIRQSFGNPDKLALDIAPMFETREFFQKFRKDFESSEPPFSHGLFLQAEPPWEKDRSELFNHYQKNDRSEDRIAAKVVRKLKEDGENVILFPAAQNADSQSDLVSSLTEKKGQAESGSTQPVATFQDQARGFWKKGVWLDGQELIPKRSQKALRVFLILYEKFWEAWRDSLSRGHFVSPKPISLKTLDELLRKKDAAELEDPESSTRKLLHRMRKTTASVFNSQNLDGLIRLFPAYGYPEEAGYALTEAAARIHPGPRP